MFDPVNAGEVWAPGSRPVNQIMKAAKQMKSATGKDPLFMPWMMSPTGGDFASMTGEAMLKYADSAMGKGQRKKVDAAVRGLIPDFAGIGAEDGIRQFQEAPSGVRKKVQSLLDRDFRDDGGLSLGEARLSVADPRQFAMPEGSLFNLGRIDVGAAKGARSTHPSYPFAVPGEGIGRLDRPIMVHEMLPHIVEGRGIADPRNPSAADIRSMQLKPFSGVITDELLKRLGF